LYNEKGIILLYATTQLVTDLYANITQVVSSFDTTQIYTHIVNLFFLN